MSSRVYKTVISLVNIGASHGEQGETINQATFLCSAPKLNLARTLVTAKAIQFARELHR